MRLYMSLFAYALSDDLLRAFESINQPDATIHLHLHSRVPAVVATCEHIASHENVVYHPHCFNRGIARGINDTISAAQDANADMLICWADDIFARPGDIDRIAATVLAHPSCSYVDSPCLVEKTGRDERTGMAMSMQALRKVGYMDVNCHPLAFSDVDWMYRSKLAGLEKFTAEDTYLTHIGARTRDVMPEAEDEFMRTFGLARDYYVSKWGGDWQQEIFTCPFNDPKCGYRIARENADNPYPEHVRADVTVS